MSLSLPVLFTFVWCLAVNFSHGQEVKLNVITLDPCKVTYDYELVSYLEKDGRKFHISDSIGTIILPEPGIYHLKVIGGIEFFRLTESVKVLNLDYGQNYDTLTRTTIVKCFRSIHDIDCGYFCCDEMCDGYSVDYFDNGNRRIAGHFKAGFPIGELTFFDTNGRLKEIHYYDKNGMGQLLDKKVF